MPGISLDQLLFIFHGAGWTLLLSTIGFLGGALAGLPLALARSRGGRYLRGAAGIAVWFIQGIPLPVLMFLCYFGLSIAGYNLPSLVAAGLAMTAYSGAFLAEIWKTCIQAVSQTQWEAAACLALRPMQQVAYVVLPQAARIAVAPTVGFGVQIVKNSSYAVVIGFFDLTYSARVVNNATFAPFVVFSIAAVIYFAVCYPLSALSYRLEKRLRRASSLNL